MRLLAFSLRLLAFSFRLLAVIWSVCCTTARTCAASAAAASSVLVRSRRLYVLLAFPNAQSLPQGPLPPLPRGDSTGENVRSAMKLAVGYARYA